MSVTAAVIVPHAPLLVPGVGREPLSDMEHVRRAYRAAARSLLATQPETIVIISPHGPAYADHFHAASGMGSSGDFARWAAPQQVLTTAYDAEFVRELNAAARGQGLPLGCGAEAAPRLDHGTLTPLWFLQEAGGVNIPIVRLSPAGCTFSEHYQLGQLVAHTARRLGRRLAVVASGELSHRLKEYGPGGFAPAGPLYDVFMQDALAAADFGDLLGCGEELCVQAGECGHRCFLILAGSLDGRSVRAEQLAYEDAFGTGYAVFSFTPGAENAQRHFLQQYQEQLRQVLCERRAQEDAWVALARQAVAAASRGQSAMDLPPGLPPALMDRQAGVAVSLYKYDRLRGSYGALHPSCDCVAAEIVANALRAAVDERFGPVRSDEVDELVICVDVLGRPEPVTGPEQLDPFRYGVRISTDTRSGMLLPQLEGISDAAVQLAAARRQAGIAATEPVRLERFTSARHV